MPSPRKPFARLDVHFYNDARIMSVPVAAELLFVRAVALAAAMRSDGFVSYAQLKIIGRGIRPNVAAAHLVEVGLFSAVSRGFLIVNYSRWQTSSDEIASSGEANAARQSRYRERLAVKKARDGDLRVTRLEEKRREERT